MISTEANKFIKISAFISHGLMLNQIMKLTDLFDLCKRRFDWIDKKEFDEILIILKEGSAITGITETHIYQTSSIINKQKTIEEINAQIKLFEQ